MVCTLRSGRMAESQRLLSGNLSQTTTDDFGHQKSVVRSICRELSEANEANLIDEEDMHVFDLEPMKDPLNLVLCNACKKPIKVSHFVIHAELCKSLTHIQDDSLKLVGKNEHKKHARKDKRKLMTNNSNQATSVGEQGFNHIDTSAMSVRASQLVTNFAGVRGSLDGLHALDSSTNTFGNNNCLQPAVLHLRKSSNIVVAEEPTPNLVHFEATSNGGSQKSHPANSLLINAMSKIFPAIELPQVPTKGNETTFDPDQIPRQLHEYPSGHKGPAAPNVPAPLATKIYYSQRNNRDRAAISRMYYNSILKECPDQSYNQIAPQPNMIPPLPSFSNRYPLDEIVDQQQEKESQHPMRFVRNPAQISEPYARRPGGLSTNTNISYQFPVNNIRTTCTPGKIQNLVARGSDN